MTYNTIEIVLRLIMYNIMNEHTMQYNTNELEEMRKASLWIIFIVVTQLDWEGPLEQQSVALKANLFHEIKYKGKDYSQLKILLLRQNESHGLILHDHIGTLLAEFW